MFIPTWLILILVLAIPGLWSTLAAEVKGVFIFAGNCIAFPFRVLGRLFYGFAAVLCALGALIPDCIVDMKIRII